MKSFVQRADFLQLVEACSGAVKALNVTARSQVDLIFINTEMSEMSWIKFIASVCGHPQIIVNTTHAEYAVEAFEYGVTDYLVRPYSYARFLKAVSKAKRIFEAQRSGRRIYDFLLVKTDSRRLEINVKEILFVTASDRAIMINLCLEAITIHSPLQAIANRLPSEEFIQVNHTTIAHLDKISFIEDNTLVINDRRILIEKPYWDDLNQRIKLK